MNLVRILPGAAASAHYHRDPESAIYLLQGLVETRYGEGLCKSVLNRAGDFIFIPPNVPHQPRNLNKDSPAIAIVSHGSKRAGKRGPVSDRWDSLRQAIKK